MKNILRPTENGEVNIPAMPVGYVVEGAEDFFGEKHMDPKLGGLKDPQRGSSLLPIRGRSFDLQKSATFGQVFNAPATMTFELVQVAYFCVAMKDTFFWESTQPGVCFLVKDGTLFHVVEVRAVLEGVRASLLDYASTDRRFPFKTPNHPKFVFPVTAS